MELLFSFWKELFELYHLTEQLLKMMKFLQIMLPTENLPDFEAQVALTEQIFCILESAQARSSTILLQLLRVDERRQAGSARATVMVMMPPSVFAQE